MHLHGYFIGRESRLDGTGTGITELWCQCTQLMPDTVTCTHPGLPVVVIPDLPHRVIQRGNAARGASEE